MCVCMSISVFLILFYIIILKANRIHRKHKFIKQLLLAFDTFHINQSFSLSVTGKLVVYFDSVSYFFPLILLLFSSSVLFALASYVLQWHENHTYTFSITLVRRCRVIFLEKNSSNEQDGIFILSSLLSEPIFYRKQKQFISIDLSERARVVFVVSARYLYKSKCHCAFMTCNEWHEFLLIWWFVWSSLSQC